MTYQVLARKWRPQDFSSLVGQDQIVTALRNGLTENRIAQAYLFSGIRGVGKTTAARVLAKALNCERRTGGDPCNECPSCLEIGSGNTMDVIEVDAATYSKVEQVRELTETLRYGPAKNPYKVVVLDEVHRLSRQAFDALLKIVEEPPAHLVFIFATTEIDAVPATILSRCQEYQFRRVPSPVLAQHLRTICDAESIEVSDVALRLIARAGEGSVRDSVALLDQMATFGSGRISDDDAKRLLGGLDSAIFQKLLSAILSGEHAPILEVVAEIESNGWDPHNVYSQFLGFSRDALHLVLGNSVESVELPEEECRTLQEILKPYGYEALLQVIQLLISSEGMVRRSEMGILALEIAWLRAAELPKIQRLQDVLAGRADVHVPNPGPPSPGRRPPSGPVEARSPSPPTRSVRRTAPVEEADAAPKSAPQPAATQPAATQPAAPQPAVLDAGRIPAFLDLLGMRKPPLVAHLRSAELSVEGHELRVHTRGNSLLEKALGRKSNRKSLDQAIEEIWGPGGAWTTTVEPAPAAGSLEAGSSEAGSSEARAPEPEPTAERERPYPGDPPGVADRSRKRSPRSASPEIDLEAVADLPTVRAALDMFDGKIRSIAPIEEPTA